MVRPGFFILLLWASVSCFSQQIKIIVPQKPVMVGTAFQVQYIVTAPDQFSGFTHPVFDGFRVVSGPSHTKGHAQVGGQLQPIINHSYTLVPLKAGKARVAALKGTTGTGVVESEDAIIDVLARRPSQFSSADLHKTSLETPTSDDVEKMVADNLFIRTEVDKSACYVGEPVVATYILYSRVQSLSVAERSPAFYGFSVIDLIDFKQSSVKVRILEGKAFNTLVLRKVLLFPVQSGTLVLDPMYVHNSVEITDPVLQRRVPVRKELKSAPIKINVKPLPAEKPREFSGATGDFKLSAFFERVSIRGDQQGKLIVVLKGTGNFIQIAQPAIRWPRGMEGFEPVVTDNIAKTEYGLSGERKYEYSFTADSGGNYQLPDIHFSYFDPQTRQYQTADVRLPPVHVSEPVVQPAAVKPVEQEGQWLLPVSAALVAVAGLLLFFMRSKRRTEIVHEPQDPGANETGTAEQEAPSPCFKLLAALDRFEKASAGNLERSELDEIQFIKNECLLRAYSGVTGDENMEALEARANRLFTAKGYSEYL